jgi:phage gp46-like protein
MRIIPLVSPAEPMLSPDLVWDGIMGDLALADPAETDNRGGLRARAQLETAVLICLMTDARVAAEELRDGDVNRGWPGDTFDLAEANGEAPIGSKLWLLERSTVDAVDTPRRAEEYALAALQTLIDQGAAAAATATAEADPPRNRLTLSVMLADKAGTLLVALKFRVLWTELNGIEV